MALAPHSLRLVAAVLCSNVALVGRAETAAQLYSIGEPTGEEQQDLELINRARRIPRPVTAPSGGYTAPLPNDGAYSVTFSGGGLPDEQAVATVVNRQNVKRDYIVAAAADRRRGW